MEKFETGAVRDTGGKGRMDLLPMCALLRVSKHMEDALTHYPERNWENGLPMHSMIDSAMRHIVKYMDGMRDEDHLCAAATNLLMAMWTEEKKPDMQDIPSRLKKCVDRSANTAEQTPGQMTIGRSNKQYERCDYYHQHGTKFLCLGNKETKECGCGGNRFDCDFYPKYREGHGG